MTEPIETVELQAFLRTVEAGSLSRAAFELGIPRATLSRRLARLEERLGVRLLTRTTRALSLTDAGEAFCKSGRLALDAVLQAEDSVRREAGEVSGSLRVSVPPFSLPSFYMMLCRFAERYPKVDFHVNFSTQIVDLMAEGFHVALRASRDLGPGLVARTLVRAPTVAVAAPEYVRRKGEPRRSEDLAEHHCLVGFERGEIPETHWPLLSGGKVPVRGTFASNNVELLTAAAQSGLGIALLPMQVVDDSIRSGKLVQILPQQVGMVAKIALVYPEKEFLPPQVRAFIDAVVAWAPEAFAEIGARYDHWMEGA